MKTDTAKTTLPPGKYDLAVEFYVFPSLGRFYALCPSLDILAAGEDNAGALGIFHRLLDLYFDLHKDIGALAGDLLARGWRVKEKQLIPPPFSQQLQNETLRELMDTPHRLREMRIPGHCHH